MHLLKYTFSAILRCLIATLAVFGLTACADDEYLMSPDDNFIPEGTSTVMLEASYAPFAEGNLSRSTLTPPGDGMNAVQDLVIVVYDKDGKMVGEPNNIQNFKAEPEDRYDSNASNGQTAEDKTLCIKNIPLTLKNGRYYIVAIANLPYEDADGNVIEGKSTYDALTAEGVDISTLDKLRALKVHWQTNNYTQNREMFGYFDVRDASAPNWGSDIPLVTFKPGVSLRAWLRRCVSKITIDFDGSELNEDVHIYIKSAKIYDIPQACTLGFGRTPGENDSYISYNNTPAESELIHSISHVIDYEADYGKDGKGPHIAAGSPFITDADGNKVDLHKQTSNALFFYENMQGNAPKGKSPIADLVNGGVAQGEPKDGVPAGTYIEVVAEYKSNAVGNIGGGEIKYRFMLGKDADKSCDAERNYHYKLTLKFHGYANEYDWHIDYKDIPDTWDIPQPWYVSYLYNHRSVLPFKYTPPEGWEVTRLDAEIVNNPWYANVGKNDDGTLMSPPNDEDEVYNDPDNKSNANGFLSLHKTKDVVITTQMNDVNTWPGYSTSSAYINDPYYYGRSAASNGIDRSKRTYYFDGTSDESANDPQEQYSSQRNGDKMEFQIPLFTRAKVLVKQTGYSGNNPFVAYERVANVKFTVSLRKIDNHNQTAKRDTIVEVRQVRRIVNPKGVYRRSGNNEDFAVHLMELRGDQDEKFSDFQSDGPWMAEIVGDKNFITLDGKNIVHGQTNSSIKFNIRFNKLNKDNKVRNAVVRVLYNSYTCTHLIFVRQGYAPQAIVERATNYLTPTEANGQRKIADQTPTIWRTFNLISRNEEATDPRDEGSLFKFGNSGNGIDASDNVYLRNGKVDCRAPENENGFVVQGPFHITDPDNKGKLLATTKAWTAFSKDDKGFTHTSLSNLATIRDYEQLYGTPFMQFGYGVLYADGATTTQEDVNAAYGYFRNDPENKKDAHGNITTDSHKGMRGMFAYYWNIDDPNNAYTAKNVFFPIGRSGYGHRKEGLGTKETHHSVGMLRYCALGHGYRSVFKDAGPLFCTLYHRPGAIYYAKDKVANFMTWDTANNTEAGNAIGLDINYFSFDVNAIQESNVDSGADACFLRKVGNY